MCRERQGEVLMKLEREKHRLEYIGSLNMGQLNECVKKKKNSF